MGDELEVVGDANERPRVAGKHHDGKSTKDGVYSAALEAELTKV